MTINDFARIGAAKRLEEIDTERAAILAHFPDLPPTTPTLQGEITRRVKKPHWATTPQGKARLRRRMRQVWKARKAGKKS